MIKLFPFDKTAAARKVFVVLAAWALIGVTFFTIIKDWPTLEQWKSVFSTAHIWAVLTMVLMFVIATVLRAMRWGMFLKGDIDFEWSQMIALFAWCFFLTAFFPFKLGELARPMWVKRQGGSAFIAAGTIIVERLTDLLVLMALLGIVGIYAPQKPEWMDELGVTYLVALASFYLLLSFFSTPINGSLDRFYRSQRSRKGYAARLSPLVQKAKNLVGGMTYLQRRQIKFVNLLLSSLIWVSLSVGFYCFLTSFFPALHWTAAVAVLCAVNLTGLVAVTPGNIGMYELAAVVTLAVFLIPSADALVVATGLHATVLAAIVSCGAAAKLYLKSYGHRLWDIL